MSSDIDIILPEIPIKKGSLHPINNMKDSIMDLLVSIGFEIIHGPEIETEEYNFDMLNIKEFHPARQMHDTFYVNNKENVLRTHTSPVQIRGMLNNQPPLAFISGGKVFLELPAKSFNKSKSAFNMIEIFLIILFLGADLLFFSISFK